MGRFIDRSYRVNFSLSKVTLYEQQEFYTTFMKYLPNKFKDKLSITIIDPVNGQHKIMTQSGITPNGEICEKCSAITCEKCAYWNRLEEQHNVKNSDNI